MAQNTTETPTPGIHSRIGQEEGEPLRSLSQTMVKMYPSILYEKPPKVKLNLKMVEIKSDNEIKLFDNIIKIN